ncbi:MAG: MATE family efflux transporter [Rhizobiales bacterium 63-7]|nr:MATE family efflux transporter [Hyphomicrobiales bacterium]OJU72102.1 MAG: MATE family efflux transporter [Rhizobiales bacterium 63-7]
MPSRQTPDNPFLTAPPGRLFLSNAAPIVFVMVMSGLLSIIDAAFLGLYVGPRAVAAIGLIFPALMLFIALSTLVGSGMSSLYARRLGAGEVSAAASVFASAHGLALTVAVIVILLIGLLAKPLVTLAAGGDDEVAAMALTFLRIAALATPVQFLLGLHIDALRNEGRAAILAPLSVGTTLANIALNYLLIVQADLGVAGSALGTAMAQVLAFAIVLGLRARGGRVPLSALMRHSWVGGWGRILGLGAPVSLSFIGIAFVSTCVLSALSAYAGPAYLQTVAAYGIVIRLIGFAWLPMMGMALAMQSVVGNNVGAGLLQRSDAVLRIALVSVLVYCAGVEIVFLAGASVIGGWFVSDAAVAAEVGRILPRMTALYLVIGPVLIFALYFQTIGQPKRTSLLTLAKPFLLQPVLIVLLSTIFGEPGIWIAVPMADLVVAVIAVLLFLKLRGPRPGFGFSPAMREVRA